MGERLGRPRLRPAVSAHTTCRFCGCVLCTAESHEGLCSNLVRNGLLADGSALAAAFRMVDRVEFAPDGGGSWAYVDAALYLDFGAQISAPHVHAHALSLLFSDEDMLNQRLALSGSPVHVLDIGFGSGVVSALLCSLLSLTSPDDAQWKVLAVEHMPELVTQARANLEVSHQPMLDTGRLEMLCCDGRQLLGLMPQLRHTFAYVHCGCAVPPDDEAWLMELLAPGGRAVYPRGDRDTPQRLCVMEAGESGDSAMRETDVVVMYVPATSEADQRTRGDEWDDVVSRCRTNADAYLLQ